LLPGGLSSSALPEETDDDYFKNLASSSNDLNLVFSLPLFGMKGLWKD
jgi:hypothetical protein